MIRARARFCVAAGMLVLLAIARASTALGQEDGETIAGDAVPKESDEAAATSLAGPDEPPGPGNPRDAKTREPQHAYATDLDT